MKLTNKGLVYIQNELKKDIPAVYQGLQECLAKLPELFSKLEQCTDFSDFGLMLDSRREMVSTYAGTAISGNLTELNWVRGERSNYYFPESAEDYTYATQFRVLFFFKSNKEFEHSVAKQLETLADALTTYSEHSSKVLSTRTVTVDSQVLLLKTTGCCFYDSFAHNARVLELAAA